jgi:hypothetical protein
MDRFGAWRREVAELGVCAPPNAFLFRLAVSRPVAELERTSTRGS